jgi:hypothetical protein
MSVPADRVAGFVEQLVEAGADAPFQAEGLLFWMVPRWIVEAYARARYARTPILNALVEEALGKQEAVGAREHPEAIIWNMARGWATRLADLERRVRAYRSAA